MSEDRRRLVLLRHATAAPGSPDAERQLTREGLTEAVAVGRWLAQENLLGDVVLCSPATRTRQTWAAIQEATGHGVLISMEPSIYEADVATLLQVVRDLDATSPEARTAVVVGHAPGMPALAYDLCDGQGEGDDVAALTRGFVPASVAVVDFAGAWGDLHPGACVLAAVRPGD